MSERRRLALLWLCLALFVLRVMGQLAVLLLTPSFLPPFAAMLAAFIALLALAPAQGTTAAPAAAARA